MIEGCLYESTRNVLSLMNQKTSVNGNNLSNVCIFRSLGCTVYEMLTGIPPW